MKKSEEAIKNAPNPDVSTTAVINNDKDFDISSFVGKSFYNTTPKKDIKAHEEIRTQKKSSTDTKIDSGCVKNKLEQKLEQLEEQQRKLEKVIIQLVTRLKKNNVNSKVNNVNKSNENKNSKNNDREFHMINRYQR